MAYKKYIKRGGKIYGPYIYHSKRIDGKVVSEYRGTDKSKKFTKNLSLIFAGVFLLVILLAAFYVTINRGEITGESVLNLNVIYQEGEPLNGNLRLFLQEGELIPESSKLIFESEDSVYEYRLSDIISDGAVEGNYFLEESSISGSGSGYGIPGKKEIFPEVSFVLSILSGAEFGQSKKTSPEESTGEVVGPIESAEANGTGTTESQQKSSETNETAQPNEAEQEPAEESGEAEEETTGVIENILEVVSNFFLSLVPTGKAVVEFEKEVSGIVSKGEVFTHTLAPGETAEIKPRSLTTASGKLSDNEIDLVIENNQVFVTTDYSEFEEGFGEDYIGKGEKEIVIDLSNLNLILEKGPLNLSISYLDENILTLSTNLEDGSDIILDSGPKDVLEEIQNETPEVNFSIQEPIILEELKLTPEERNVLESKFGNISVEATEAISKNGFLTIRYELDIYWIEFTYSEDLDNVTLESFVEQDRIKWLKDISKLLSEVETPEQSVGGFLGSFEV